MGTKISADQWISRLIGAGLAVVAGVAAIVSYRHMRDLSARHGEDGLSSTILPLSVDGLLAVAALVLLADARANRRSGRATAWFAVTLGIGASVAANVAHAEPTWTGRLIGLWAPVALAVALELALRHVRHVAALSVAPTVGSGPAVKATADPLPVQSAPPVARATPPAEPPAADPVPVAGPPVADPDPPVEPVGAAGGSTRHRVAALVSRIPADDPRSDRALAAEWAPLVGVTPSTVRNHLSALRREES
ncbi:DUF2637 domain-containing protein [Frankia sp. CiP1_Cm_nod2]|uniref:DUF2637 domain-containing protein n=1 Tax=Frankia sp. CiP1_Cm_nod2 TaxID=2897161 RepID=UPI0020255009